MSDDLDTRTWLKSLIPFIAMCGGMFIALLDIQIVASSLQEIGGGLSAAQDQIGWLQTAYLIAEIIVIPLSGWLTRVFSTRWLFAGSAAGFTLASLLCAFAWDIQSMIVFRALQGLLGASMVPTVFTASFHFFPGKRRVYTPVLVATIAYMAPALGPVIGGWITDNLNWHWLFYINIVPGILVTVLTAKMVKIDELDLALLKGADYIGMALMALFLGLLEYVLEEGSRWNWFDDFTIRTCAWIAALSGALFVARSLTYHNPVVDLRALGNRNFALGSAMSFVTGIVIFGTIYLIPLFLAYIRGYSAWQTGEAIFATGLASMGGVPIYIWLAKRVDGRWLMMFGLAAFGVSMFTFTDITSTWSGNNFLIPQLLRGFPQLFAVAPSILIGLGAMPPERLKYASGLFNMMRNLGGAVGIAACSAVLNDRTNYHYTTIAAQLTNANGAMDRFIAASARHYDALSGSGGHMDAVKQLFRVAVREAETMAYADAFWMIAAVCLAASLLALFMKKVGAPAGSNSGGH